MEEANRPVPARLAVWLVAAALLGDFALAALPASGGAPPAPAGFQLQGDAERGRALFAKHCALCHGAAGDAKGKLAASLDPPPKDLTDGARMAKVSDWEIYLAIRDGGQAIGLSAKMFGWGKILPDPAIRDLATYVRTLSRR
jgi:cytochrome c oxidase cbb3-type subunit III